MADISKLSDRMETLNEKIDTMEREHNALDALAQTPTERRRVRRLDLKIEILRLDREDVHERMVAELARSY